MLSYLQQEQRSVDSVSVEVRLETKRNLIGDKSATVLASAFADSDIVGEDRRRTDTGDINYSSIQRADDGSHKCMWLMSDVCLL